ncbi:AraC family transcriptional regulator [Herbiconiux ginsengi]|uniref:Transcriptional regulator, AraC family n=1 Tax=Herbiconiux ginsengi TaxID=381665 RepID=A0A1H3RTS7_9MICO|nr:AraC family transcriptional regulator [Herbiconiux ginsengi]SDZ29052.1 transcriptional regulator, AraC family [Herbiconiux ginsengi]
MNRADYVRQVVAVSDFIYEHLDEDLDLNRLAEVAHVSPFHWHRIYRAMCGETAAATVRRLRLQRAADYLAGTTLTVREVAARSGFASTEVFSRSFSAAYGMPPAQYRSVGAHVQFRAGTGVPGPTAASGPTADDPGEPSAGSETRAVAAAAQPAAAGRHPVAIRGIEARVVATSPHRGSYLDIGRVFTRVRQELAVGGVEGRMLAVYYDDPDATDAHELRSAAGVVVAADHAVPPSLELLELPAGEYAVLSYRGPYASMHAAYTWLYGSWLPSSGRTPGDQPVVEEYLTDPATTAPGELRTDILLLLE